jgi:hypothetical protein
LYLRSFQLYVTKANCVLFCNTFRQYNIFTLYLVMKKTLLYFFGLLLFSLCIRDIYHEDISLQVSISHKAFQTLYKLTEPFFFQSYLHEHEKSWRPGSSPTNVMAVTYRKYQCQSSWVGDLYPWHRILLFE